MNTNGSLFREKGSGGQAVNNAIYRTNKTVDVEKFIFIEKFIY